jgi:hypothetical protein
MLIASLPLEQLGAIAGGAVAGIAGIGAVGFWFAQRALERRRTAQTEINYENAPVGRTEFNSAMTSLREEIDVAAEAARNAHSAAAAAQASVSSIAQVIEVSMRSLGDRLEGALRDIKITQDRISDDVTNQGSRITTVETELDIAAGRPPRQH